MTTEKMPKETETTMKPLIMSSAEINEEENMVPQTTVTSQGNNSTSKYGTTVRIRFKKLLNKKEIQFRKEFLVTKMQFTVIHDSK